MGPSTGPGEQATASDLNTLFIGVVLQSVGPCSPVRIRIACSRSKRKILPSPTLPVLADFSITSMTWSSKSPL
jgi:hypothetical protein